MMTEPQLRIERPAFSQDSLHDVSDYAKPRINCCSKMKQYFSEKASTCKPMKMIRGVIPLFDWLPQYQWKTDFPCDIIAGVTVAIMHIPQGLGYALLAHVDAVTGIYMAFFPQIPYFIFGTSRHNSMGTFAVITILVGRSVNEFANNSKFQHSVYIDVNGTMTAVLTNYTNIEVGTSLTLLVSFWHFIFYACRMGIICTLLSDALVNSFICGAGVHIFTSQIKEIFGVKPGKYTGPAQLLLLYYDMGNKVVYAQRPETIYACLIISAICITILLLNLYFLKPWLEKFTRIPFPMELVLVVAGVLIAKSMNLSGQYGVPDIGKIPKGIPGPVFPYLNLFQQLLMNSFVTAVVAYAVSMSMALILAEGENYEVDANQEFLAHGISNFVGAVFKCIVFGASLSRSMVLRGVGGKTQFTGLIASGIIVIILLWIADFFEPLPKAVLASIIIVALKKILMQVTDFPKFWKKSRMDGFVWLVVFISVIVIDIDYGLGIGFLLSIGCIFLQGLKAYTCLLGNIPNTDLYLDINRYRAAMQINGIKIIHYRGALNFATRQHLKLEIMKLTNIDPKKELKRKKKMEKANRKLEKQALEASTSAGTSSEGITNIAFVGDHTQLSMQKKVSNIILDFSALSNIDPAGAGQVKKLTEEFKNIDITITIAGCSGPVYEKIKKCGYLEGEEPLCLFPTIHDAVHHAQLAFQNAAMLDIRSRQLGAPAL